MSMVSNRLLAVLPREISELLISRATPVALPLRKQLYEPDHTPRYIYFLTSGIASVVAPMVDGEAGEVEIIGREGLVGSFHLLGPAPISTSCFMQIAGTGLRMELDDVRDLFLNTDEVRARILEFIQLQALTISHLSACNSLHGTEARLARWLLMTQDRTQSDVLHLTQQFLAEMLGAQRTTVTANAGTLQRMGLIQYRQGKVKIIDREGLKAAACDCYRVIERLHADLYALPWQSHSLPAPNGNHTQARLLPRGKELRKTTQDGTAGS